MVNGNEYEVDPQPKKSLWDNKLTKVVVVVVVFGLTLLLVTQIRNNSTAIDKANAAAKDAKASVAAIQADRTARIIAACAKDHQAYLDTLASDQLLSDLLHTAIPLDKIPPEQLEQARQYLAGADAKIEANRANAEKRDCTKPDLPQK